MTLVCVAPDGSLEVWYGPKRHLYVDAIMWYAVEGVEHMRTKEEIISYRCYLFDNINKNLGPEQWGREVIGEL